LNEIPDGFQCYHDYINLKLHFNNLDFIWSSTLVNSKVKLKAFEMRNDVRFFYQLASRVPDRVRRIELLISGLLFDNDIWIGDFFNSDVQDFHSDRCTRLQSLIRFFEKDCEMLSFWMVDNQKTLNDILLTSGIKDVIINKLIVDRIISLETASIFHHISGFALMWFPIQPLLQQRRMQIIKYHHVLNIDEKKQGRLLKIYQTLA
jgi:hypothetical protein